MKTFIFTYFISFFCIGVFSISFAMEKNKELVRTAYDIHRSKSADNVRIQSNSLSAPINQSPLATQRIQKNPPTNSPRIQKPRQSKIRAISPDEEKALSAPYDYRNEALYRQQCVTSVARYLANSNQQ